MEEADKHIGDAEPSAGERLLLPLARSPGNGDDVPDRRPEAPTVRRPADVAAGLLRAIQRLESVVDEETSALEASAAFDLDESSRRKNRGLLELVRSSRAAGDLDDDPRIAHRLSRLRARLERNHAVLQMHLEAVREVSAIITRAIREAESDGTYTVLAPGQGK